MKKKPRFDKLWLTIVYQIEGEKMSKVLHAVKIELEMRNKLEELSKRTVLSLADVTRIALSEYIQKYEKEHGEIKTEKKVIS